MQGHQQHVRYPQYRGQIKPQHTKFQVGMGSGGGSGSGSGGVGRRAEGGGVADDVCASGLVGRRLQSLPTSLFAPSSSRPVNPLDLPMLWPQPPSSLGSAVPTASGITPPLAAGGAQDTPNRASGTGGFARGAAAEENLLAPTVRSYVTYGRGRFSSRQLAAVSNVRSRDGGMHESFPRRAVGTAGTASAAGAYTSRLQRHDAHHGNNGGGGGGDAEGESDAEGGGGGGGDAGLNKGGGGTQSSGCGGSGGETAAGASLRSISAGHQPPWHLEPTLFDRPVGDVGSACEITAAHSWAGQRPTGSVGRPGEGSRQHARPTSRHPPRQTPIRPTAKREHADIDAWWLWHGRSAVLPHGAGAVRPMSSASSIGSKQRTSSWQVPPPSRGTPVQRELSRPSTSVV
jgi:hypothetical protein